MGRRGGGAAGLWGGAAGLWGGATGRGAATVTFLAQREDDVLVLRDEDDRGVVDFRQREPEGVVLEPADQLACVPWRRAPVRATASLGQAGERKGCSPRKFHTVTSFSRKARKVWFS